MKIKRHKTGAMTITEIEGIAREPLKALYDKNGKLVVGYYCRAYQRYTVSEGHTRVLSQLSTLGNIFKHWG